MPSAAALVPLPMDDTTPPVTKIYLVSLIYTPKKEQRPLPSLIVGKGKRIRRRRGAGSSLPANLYSGAPAWISTLLRRTCMDLYHTTSGTRMKQEIAQRYCKRLDLAQTNVAILPSERANRKACRQGTRGPRSDHCT